MSWLKKINIAFLVIVLLAPVLCVTVAVIYDAPNISALTITIIEEEQKEKEGGKEIEKGSIKSFLPQNPISSQLKSNGFNFCTKGVRLQNRSGDIFSPPPEIA